MNANRMYLAAGKRLLPLIGLALLCGCAQHYVMKLSDGYSIESVGKPKLVGGSFRYRDALGRDHYISEGRVMEMEPASMAKDEQKTFTTPRQHPPRHWYFLWLA